MEVAILEGEIPEVEEEDKNSKHESRDSMLSEQKNEEEVPSEQKMQ